MYDTRFQIGNIPANKKHGEGNSRLYKVWHGMINRCHNPNSKNYKNYGQRGIRVCDDWHSYEAFRNWAKKNGYSESLQIDRINVDGNYEPGNCRWVTNRENSCNRRDTIYISVYGETKRLVDWIEDERCKIKSLAIVRGRIHMGWNPEIAMTKPIRKKQLNPEK